MVGSKKQKELRARILDKIYSKGPISRIDISKETGITPATISSITGKLIKEGLLYEIGEDETDVKVGRKKILLTIKKERMYFIGCEISEQHLTFSLCDNTGISFATDQVITKPEEIESKGTELFIHSLKAFISRLNLSFEAIGIAIPGRYTEKSNRIMTNNKIWQHFNLDQIRNSVEKPVFFSNNVNCMALAKRLLTPSKDENFIYFHFARGMHCSYIYNGKIYGKRNLVIGEIGHTVVQFDGNLCGCGRRGCLQTYASTKWIIRKARILYQTSANSYLPSLANSIDDITIQTIFAAYELGDSGIGQILEQAIYFLTSSVLNLNMMIDAQKIYLHSPLFNNDKFTQRFKAEISKHPRLLLNELPELIIEPYNELTGAFAAVALCLDKILLSY